MDKEDKADTLLREVAKVLRTLGYNCVKGTIKGPKGSLPLDKLQIEVSLRSLDGWDPTKEGLEWILLLRRDFT
jgi:hypothetical protein